MATKSPATQITTLRPARRWFQFSLRTLLVTVSVVAVVMGLLLRHINQMREAVRLEKEAAAAIKKLGGSVSYASQLQPVLASSPAWLRSILGDEEYRPVSKVSLNFRRIMDVELVHLSNLTALQYLDLRYTQFTDAGLVYLSKLNTLQSLQLDNTQLTDAGVAKLQAALPQCKIIWLPRAETKP